MPVVNPISRELHGSVEILRAARLVQGVGLTYDVSTQTLLHHVGDEALKHLLSPLRFVVQLITKAV